MVISGADFLRVDNLLCESSDLKVLNYTLFSVMEKIVYSNRQ